MTEAIYTIDGKEFPFAINEDLHLNKRYLYLDDEIIFDTFRRGSNTVSGSVTYNDVDITKVGRELFKIPSEYNNHFTRVRIRP